MNPRFLATGMDELQEVNGPVKMSTGTVPVSESSFLDLSLAAICKHLVRCREVCAPKGEPLAAAFDI